MYLKINPNRNWSSVNLYMEFSLHKKRLVKPKGIKREKHITSPKEKDGG